MFKKKGKIISGIFIGLLALVGIGANVAAGVLSDAISIYLNGYGNDFSNLNTEDSDKLCQEIAGEGIVLLKNENNCLPLKDVTAVNVFGWGGSDGGFIVSGAGSGSSADRGSGQKVTLLQAFENKGISTNPDLNNMYKEYCSARDNTNYWNAAYPFFNLIEPPASEVEPLMDSALAYSDTAIVVISRLGGEGQDLPHTQKKKNLPEDTTRTYLELSTEEEEMLAMVETAGFTNVIVLLNTTNAMEVGFLEDENINAALEVSALGQSGAESIVDVLTGEINPSGKLVDTYAYDLETAATYANCPNCREVDSDQGGIKSYTDGGNYIDYQEDIYVGYRWYETADAEGYWDDIDNEYGQGYDGVVQYPFGYGLSYSSFDWKIDSVSPANGSTITPDTEITVKVWVTNTSTLPGKDVVELYYSAPYTKGGIEKSAVCLCDFAKTQELEEAGEDTKCAQLVTLTLTGRDMESYDAYDKNGNGFKGYELEAGDYVLSLQSDAHHRKETTDGKNTLTYHVEEDYQLSEDETTGYTVENRFTGASSDDGVSIDGSDSDANITYLSREDFASTFPVRTTERRTKTSAIKALGNHWLSDKSDTEEMPVTGSTATDYQLYDGEEPNTDFLCELGEDYDDPTYEDLLDQMSVSDLNLMVEGCGYRTPEIDSIGKPEFLDLDGPSGLNDTNMSSDTKAKWTSFPVETALAQSWNKNLAYTFGLAVGREAGETGVGGWYAPACNIHRSPYDGRNFEYYSEDPYQSGIFAAETIRGATNNGLYCYVKHFAVNETENGRSGLYTWLTEQSLREIYLKPFEIAVKKGSANAVMSSFNRLGATWTGGSYSLLTEVLRNEWGFRGTVLTDYSSGGDYMNVDQGLRAGNDTWLNGLRTNSVQGHDDKSSATALTCARRAAHDVIYTYCNTVYRQKRHAENPGEDTIKVDVGGKTAATPSHSWVWILVAGDVVLFGGLLTWAYFAYFHKGKKREEEASSK